MGSTFFIHVHVLMELLVQLPVICHQPWKHASQSLIPKLDLVYSSKIPSSFLLKIQYKNMLKSAMAVYTQPWNVLVQWYEAGCETATIEF